MKVTRTVPAKMNKAPFPFCGKLVCSEETERQHNLLANFIESFWQRQGGEDFAVSSTFGESKVIFWVSAETQERLNDFMDFVLDLLKRGFEQSGQQCEISEVPEK